MSRSKFDPREFGVELDQAEFVDEMVDDFNAAYQRKWTIDELLLHSREAIRCCDDVRHKRGYYDVPVDIILRSIIQRRKNT